MNPSSEVEETSGEETGMGVTMEALVTTVDAMTSVVETVEAMVMAVEMRGWLEMRRTETERTTAVHFFSRALTVQKRNDVNGIQHCVLPLYWPGLLPDLVPLLTKCLLPHNSKAIKSGAMLSIKYLISSHAHRLELRRQVASPAYGHLLRLVRKKDCTDTRDQAIWLLGRMTTDSLRADINTAWVVDLLPLLTDLVAKYAAIRGPKETGISSLNTAMKALAQVLKQLLTDPSHPQPFWEPHFQGILPALMGIFQEPGKRKKAQIRAGQLLADLMMHLDGIFLLQSGVIEMLLVMLRVGKGPTAALVSALQALQTFLDNFPYGRGQVQKMLDMGALDVFHLVLKRPNDRFKDRSTLWNPIIKCLESIVTANPGVHLKAILNHPGLVDTVLDLALGMDTSEEQREYHIETENLLRIMTVHCSESQMRQLMFKGTFFRLLSRYLNWGDFSFGWTWGPLTILESCLALCSAADQRILRRLLDDTGITDALRRISLDHGLASHILDTYLTNPLPPLPTHKLPSIIYTRNAPS